jgi:hypothetical protein
MGTHSSDLRFRARALFIATLLAAGCASVPDAPEAQQNRARSFQPPPGKALVYVLRPSQLDQIGTLAELELDSRKFGTLSPKTYLSVAVPPGRHELKVVTFHETVGQSFEAGTGRLHFFEVTSKKGRWRLAPMAENEARADLAEFRLSGHNTFEAGSRVVR